MTDVMVRAKNKRWLRSAYLDVAGKRYRVRARKEALIGPIAPGAPIGRHVALAVERVWIEGGRVCSEDVP